MKFVRPFIMAVLLVIHVVATYGSTSPEIPSDSDHLSTLDIDFNKIFFHGGDGQTLFIDFEAVNIQLLTISLSQGETVFLEDQVADLPLNTIYELNLDIIRPGDYVLELVTLDGISIQKDIKVF